jgi:hypothetical protein
MLFLRVNDKLPGDTLDIAPGTKVRVTAEALGPGVKSLAIVGHGKELARGAPAGNGRFTAEVEITPAHGLWIAAKCAGGQFEFAHTTPVYVTVNGGSFQNPEKARANVALSEEWLRELEQELASPGSSVDSQASRHRAELQREIGEARARLQAFEFR